MTIDFQVVTKQKYIFLLDVFSVKKN